MTSVPSVHCVTAVWSHRGHLPLVLQALEAQDLPTASLTVVDNASGDDVRSWLAKAHPQIACLRNFNNQGIARGLNQAIRLILEHLPEPGPNVFVAFIAPDVVLSHDALRLCVEALRDQPHVAAVAPKVFVAHSHPLEDGEGSEIEPTNLIDHVGIELLRSRHWRWRQRNQPSNAEQVALETVFAVSGSCVVIRASVLALLRVEQEWLDALLSDEQLFIDLSWRIHLAQYDVAVLPTAFAWRIQANVTKARWSAAQLFTERLCAKNDTLGNMLRHLPWRLAGSLRVAWFLLGHPRSLSAWFQDQILPRSLKQKRAAQKTAIKRTAGEVRKLFR